jgi:hypothetical protein
VFLAYLVFIRPVRKVRGQLFLAAVIAVGFLSVWLLYALQIGALAAQTQRIVRVIASFRIFREITGIDLRGALVPDAPPMPATQLQSTRFFRFSMEVLLTRLPSALGVYNVPLLLIGAWVLLRRRSGSDLFVLLWIGVVSAVLFLTLPDHRYFMPVFPALALTMAQGLARLPARREQAVLLSVLYAAGSLYLFVDWFRATNLFEP